MVDKLKRVLRYIIKGVPEKKIYVNVIQSSGRELLKGKHVLITGGSRGIGFYIAQKCILEGAKVLICGRSESNLRNAKEKLGDSCYTIQCDISEASNLPSFLDKAYEMLDGRIDCLVNNAGISYHEGSFRNVTEKGFEEQFKVNFKGTYFMAKYYIQHVENAKQLQANILFITSERGSFCTEIPYGLSKAAINSLVGSLSRNLYGCKGIRINALAPGVTATDMTGHDINGDYSSKGSPIGRVFHPVEMAEVACFLLSDLSSCISGEIIHCDAGRHQSVIN